MEPSHNSLPEKAEIQHSMEIFWPKKERNHTAHVESHLKQIIYKVFIGDLSSDFWILLTDPLRMRFPSSPPPSGTSDIFQSKSQYSHSLSTLSRIITEIFPSYPNEFVTA